MTDSGFRIVGIVLAAGFSSRMGRDKALLPWPPESKSGTLLSAAINALKPFTEKIIVVAGNNAVSLTPIASALNAELALNPAPERGQFSSIQIGLRAAFNLGCDAVVLTPVDCPPLSSASLERLCTDFKDACSRGAWAVAPENNGRRGHPLFASRPLIEAFLNAPVTSNAREVKKANFDRFESVRVPDPLLTVDLNTPEEYDHAKELASNSL
jgi:CTP:molybdopterin cytidylyltransferase MocA